MTTQEIIQRLKDGNQRFVTDQLEHNQQDGARRNDLTGGQQPFAIILSCADSRVVLSGTSSVGICPRWAAAC